MTSIVSLAGSIGHCEDLGETLCPPDWAGIVDVTQRVAAKNGQATDLTFGRQSELEAYTCRDLADNSWEVAVLNWGGRKHGNLSAMGDSGAAIFNAEGKLVSILHTGMSRGISNHVTFGTPGHYVEQLIKEQYPGADFSRTKFADDDETAA